MLVAQKNKSLEAIGIGSTGRSSSPYSFSYLSFIHPYFSLSTLSLEVNIRAGKHPPSSEHYQIQGTVKVNLYFLFYWFGWSYLSTQFLTQSILLPLLSLPSFLRPLYNSDLYLAHTATHRYVELITHHPPAANCHLGIGRSTLFWARFIIS